MVSLTRFVDRDVNRWAGRSVLILLMAVPILTLDMLYPGTPVEAPPLAFAIALIASATIGLFVLYREAIFRIREWRDLRACEQLEGKQNAGVD